MRPSFSWRRLSETLPRGAVEDECPSREDVHPEAAFVGPPSNKERFDLLQVKPAILMSERQQRPDSPGADYAKKVAPDFVGVVGGEGDGFHEAQRLAGKQRPCAVWRQLERDLHRMGHQRRVDVCPELRASRDEACLDHRRSRGWPGTATPTLRNTRPIG